MYYINMEYEVETINRQQARFGLPLSISGEGSKVLGTLKQSD